MAVLKNKTQGNFVIISQNIMHDNNLNLTERGLLVTLLSLPDGWNLSIAGLSKILPDGKERIGNALNKLISYGYLTREQGRGEKGKFGANVLEVHEVPVTNDGDNPPCPENPSTVKPSPGKQSQVNNNNTRNKQVSNKECVVGSKELPDSSANPSDTLDDNSYQSLVDEFGEDIVDYQISRIRENHYKGCMNYQTVKKWCKEYQDRSSVKCNRNKKDDFKNFHEREYDYDELLKFVT